MKKYFMTLKYYLILGFMLFLLLVVMGTMQFDIVYGRAKHKIAKLQEDLGIEKNQNKYRIDQVSKVVQNIAKEYPAIGQSIEDVLHNLKEGEMYGIDQKIVDLPEEMQQFIYKQKIETHGLKKYKIFNNDYIFPVEVESAYIPEKYGEFGWRPKVFDETTYEYVYHKSIVNGVWKPHPSNDIVNPFHPEVKASNYGYVLEIGEDPLGGNYIILEHRFDNEPLRKTKYFHLSEVYVKKGEYVYKEQQIGLIGRTGMVTSQHLDWSVEEWDGKRWVHINGVIGTTHNRKWERAYYWYMYNGKWYVKFI